MAIGDQMKAQTRDKSSTKEELHGKDQQDRAKQKRREFTGQRNKLEGKKKNPTEGQPVNLD